MMMGRFGESACDAWPCWPDSASALGIVALVPTPAATAPNTEVFTKSRREKVTTPPYGDAGLDGQFPVFQIAAACKEIAFTERSGMALQPERRKHITRQTRNHASQRRSTLQS